MSALPLIALPGFGMRASVLAGLGSQALDLPTEGKLGDWVIEIARRLPLRCNLLGWSLGATLAMAFAHAHPQRLQRLVLVGATPRFIATTDWPHGMPAAQFDEFAGSVRENRLRALHRFAALQARGDVNQRRVLRELDANLADAAAISDAQLQASLAVLAQSDLRSRLGDLDIPTLVVAGARDALVPLVAVEFLAARLPNARLVTFSDASHAPFCSDRAGFISELQRFIA